MVLIYGQQKPLPGLASQGIDPFFGRFTYTYVVSKLPNLPLFARQPHIILDMGWRLRQLLRIPH